MNQTYKEYKGQFLMSLFLFLGLSGCGRPIDVYIQKIAELGYIAFITPVELSGLGTVVGGTPDRLSIFAPSDTCFPRVYGGEPTNLMHVDPISVFQFDKSFDLKVNGQILFDLLKAGTPSLGVGVNISQVKKIRLQMTNATVEYFDAVKMIDFYNNKMIDVCKKFLDQAGFVVQALRIEKLRFEFFDTTNGHIQLNAKNIKDFLHIENQVDWAIEEGVTLVIDTPKYIGYQLARLRYKDHGLALYRATEVKDNQFVFKFLGDVNSGDASSYQELFAPNWSKMNQMNEILSTNF